MAGTRINQNQINLGSETAIDLLAMQNGWKKEMITALNNKIANYASEADTMNTVVQKFMALTGNTPDSVYRRFKATYGGLVYINNITMPKTTNDTWEIIVCKYFGGSGTGEREILRNQVYGDNGISAGIDFGAYGYAIRLSIPAYKEDDPTTREYVQFGEGGVHNLTIGNKYWLSVGYADGKYFFKASTDGITYTTLHEWASDRKTECDNYCWMVVDYPLVGGDILFIDGCKIKIDGQTVFDGGGNITISNAAGANADVTWNEDVVYMPEVIQL